MLKILVLYSSSQALKLVLGIFESIEDYNGDKTLVVSGPYGAVGG